MFGRERQWTKITGKVIASKRARFRGDGLTQRQAIYVVEYTVDGETKRVELKQVMGLFRFKMVDPGVGWKVPLLLDPRSGKVEFDVDNPKIAYPGRSDAQNTEAAERDAFKRALEDK